MSHIGIYTYPYHREVSTGNLSMPYNNRTLVLNKGANNPITFTVHNADGRYTNLKDNEELFFGMFDARSNTRIYYTKMHQVDVTTTSEAGYGKQTFGNKLKRYYGCMIPAGVIADLSIGTKYRWSISKITRNGDLIEPIEYLYTGMEFQVSSELEIANDAAPMFVSSEEYSEAKNRSWNLLQHQNEQYLNKGYEAQKYQTLGSSPIRAEAQYGLVDGLSTIALYLKDFKGRIQLQGSLSNDYPRDAEDYKWFIINLDGKEYIENCKDMDGREIPSTGIFAYNFKGHFMWLRVVVSIPPIKRKLDAITEVNDYKPYHTIPKILIRR